MMSNLLSPDLVRKKIETIFNQLQLGNRYFEIFLK